MKDPPSDQSEQEFSARVAIDHVCDKFKDAWRTGPLPKIQDFIDAVDPKLQNQLVRELIQIDCDYRIVGGIALDEEAYQSRLPQFHDVVRETMATMHDRHATLDGATDAIRPISKATASPGRKDWIDLRLKELDRIFAISVGGFSIMDNHLHFLLRIDVEQSSFPRVGLRGRTALEGSLSTARFGSKTSQSD